MSLPLVRLLQLTTPALPVGAYTYSQGLEWAIDSGRIADEASAGDWIGDVMTHSLGRFELPLLAALMRAWPAADRAEVARLNEDFLASRETRELRAETVQMGYSLTRLLLELDRFTAIAGAAEALRGVDTPAFPTAWSAAACAWRIAPAEALPAYAWAWLENQVMAAIKAVPLGQSAGQRLLAALGERIPELADAAATLPEADWSNFTPALAIASCRHETQYSRLFRS
ncbi:urease accessory protein UreF [Nitrogeniibacter mangrovi]|uniref:Urease accessory protein UreF n=1 Tax=Nitrogeniibacter mangrovi TaxID=2016596 RepID=A0A6C1B1H4_9RHOO|nr:urease accessory protein UreF [Nitrogeniibacter mangrovi]QID17417.1 urease accessory protein UreF [Nitrogeniibacter mangrovi]